MHVELTHPVSYQLPLDEQCVALNPLVGQPVRLLYLGAIRCLYCQRSSKTSFGQGYCYPCFRKLARCDRCIVHPETCHYFSGTCREPEWGEQHCMQDHIVYLANTSGLKVGVTRAAQLPTRWIDQGAIQALPIIRTSNRLQAGLLEVVLKDHVADKTNWRVMLKGEAVALDLPAARDRLLHECAADIAAMQQQYGLQAMSIIDDVPVVDIHYPVNAYPQKIVAYNLDKQPAVEGVLQGIKGQYWLLDTGVLNVRKFSAYHVTFTT